MEKIIAEEGIDYAALCSQSKKSIACAASVAVTVKSVLDTPILTEEGILTDESSNAIASVNKDISNIEAIQREE